MAYVKTTWATGDVVTAVKMNNMESGIEDANVLGSNIAAEYDASGDYAIGDYCIHDNVLYKCTTGITGGEAWNADHWTQVVVTDEMGNGGSGGEGLTFIPIVYGEMDDEEEEEGATGYYLDTEQMTDEECFELLASSKSIAVSVTYDEYPDDVDVYQYSGVAFVGNEDPVPQYRFMCFKDATISVMVLTVDYQLGIQTYGYELSSGN